MENLYTGRTYAGTSFIFDKVYPNQTDMQDNADIDGIFVGRYVLVKYCDDALPQNVRTGLDTGIGNFPEGSPEKEYLDNRKKDIGLEPADRKVFRKIFKDGQYFYEEIASLNTTLSDESIDELQKTITIETENRLNADSALDSRVSALEVGAGTADLYPEENYDINKKEEYLTKNDVAPSVKFTQDAIDKNKIVVDETLSYTSKNPLENSKNWDFVNRLAGSLAVRERGWSDTQFKAISDDMYNALSEVFDSNEPVALLPNRDVGGIATSNSPYLAVESNQTLTFRPSITDSDGNCTYDGARKLMLFTEGDFVSFDFQNPEDYDVTDYGYSTAYGSTGLDMFSISDGTLKATGRIDNYSVGALVLKKNGNPIELIPGKKYSISLKYRYNRTPENFDPWICITQGANYGTINNWIGISADSSVMPDVGNYTYAISTSQPNHRANNKITTFSTSWETITQTFIAYDVASSNIKNYLCLTICAGQNHSVEIDDIVIYAADDLKMLRLNSGTYRIKYSYKISPSVRDKLVNFKENDTWLQQPPFVKFMDNLDANSYKCKDPYNPYDEGYNPKAVIVGENICKYMGTYWADRWYNGELVFKVPEGRPTTRIDKNGNEIQSGFFGIYMGNLYSDFSIKDIAIERLEAITQSINTDIENISTDISDISADIGDISAALDELHAYAQALVAGGGQ